MLNFGCEYNKQAILVGCLNPNTFACFFLIILTTSLFEVRFLNYFTEMTTMLRRRVARKINVLTLKVKVTARPCSKIVSGP